ncbi:MAG: hypothetical protein M1829_001888 [Trizodia sp. TS-e1964]|nr:MAG: hypothetical protein M1829_001888 [Trizodia sp. TS-e1964]
MSLPPETIRVKRKWHDLPVDSLYIEIEQDPKRVNLRDFVFRRIDSLEEEPASKTKAPIESAKRQNNTIRIQEPAGLCSSNGVPIVRTSLPGEEHNGNKSVPGKTLSRLSSKQSLNKSGGATVCKAPIASMPILPPRGAIQRRFHLSRHPGPPHQSAPLGSKEHKRKRSSHIEVAIFVEHERKLKKCKSTQNIIQAVGSSENTASVFLESYTLQDGTLGQEEQHDHLRRKRPNVSVKEKNRRQQLRADASKRISSFPKKTGYTIDTPSNEWNYESSVLAAQLQAFALAETQKLPAASPRDGASEIRARKLKYRPKLQAHRPREVKSTIDGHDTDGNVASGKIESTHENDDYVFDTYVRMPSKRERFAIDGTIEPELGELGGSNETVGLLVITEEDQSKWEKFAVDSESDKDWNSEEEDENAEDFYGNDYPEDEVDFEDEYDRDAYKYRIGASDEEEFDEDTETWSDDCDE